MQLGDHPLKPLALFGQRADFREYDWPARQRYYDEGNGYQKRRDTLATQRRDRSRLPFVACCSGAAEVSGRRLPTLGQPRALSTMRLRRRALRGIPIKRTSGKKRKRSRRL